MFEWISAGELRILEVRRICHEIIILWHYEQCLPTECWPHLHFCTDREIKYKNDWNGFMFSFVFWMAILLEIWWSRLMLQDKYCSKFSLCCDVTNHNHDTAPVVKLETNSMHACAWTHTHTHTLGFRSPAIISCCIIVALFFI